MIIEIFVVESEEVKVSKTVIVEKAKAPNVDLQKMVDEAYEILHEEMKAEFANQVDLSPNDPALRDIGKFERPHEGDSHIGGDEPF